MYETYEEVDDTRQDRLESRWVINKRESHDGKKEEIKARLVARCFQEDIKPQSDSSTIVK